MCRTCWPQECGEVHLYEIYGGLDGVCLQTAIGKPNNITPRGSRGGGGGHLIGFYMRNDCPHLAKIMQL